MGSLSLEELAIEAGTDRAFVQDLIDRGALEARTGARPFGPSDVRRVQLLRTWESAGVSVEAVVDLVGAGELSFSWLDATVTDPAEGLGVTYSDLARQEDVPLPMLQGLQEALGFAPPGPQDQARGGDREMAALTGLLLAAGASPRRILGLVRVYADSLRRVAKAESELYESEVERPLRRSGWSEERLVEHSAWFGDRVIGSLERVLLSVYRRHREHVWIEHCVGHAERALARAGLHRTPSSPPAICFVDLTGYTRITEELGDEVAASMATNLASLVEDVARRRGGSPIRWLGDGGMFHFTDAAAAILAGLDMMDGAPGAGLPPMHIGVHTGPVIFQDGDVYGNTVNLASRIASHAGAGQVLASDETVERFAARDGRVRFEPLGPVSLRGISRPVTLHRAVRAR